MHTTRPRRSPAGASPVDRSVLQGLAAFRWGAWGWMAVVLVLNRDELEHPLVAAGLVASALAVTIAVTMLWRSTPEVLLRPAPVASEVAVGLALVLFDGAVYRQGHALSTSQSLGSVWPLVGVLSAGVALGPARGAMAGVVVGSARTGAALLNEVAIDTSAEVLSLTSTAVFYALAGAVAGYLYALIVRAEREVAAARAREEVARTLHDGVLQTLALVERRANDPALARLARDQERDLRAYLSGDRQMAPADPGAALRAAAARFEEAFGGRVQVLVADDLPRLGRGAIEALAGAVGEALTNAGKHGGASRVTVYVEPGPDGGVFCSVKDDGHGFDTAAVGEGMGLSRSIRGRIAEQGGRVELTSGPGAGTEVRLWLS
jgi:signal transduction histidine kinase